jgi:predicted nucleic acid-binding protein
MNSGCKGKAVVAEENPPRLRAFLDSSVIVAGVGSLTGAAGTVLDLCEAGQIEALVSELVLTEVDRAVSAKLPRFVPRLRAFLWEIKPTLVPDPSPAQVRAAAKLTHVKDAPTLAAAKNGRADYLLYLEKKHFLSLRPGVKFEPPLLIPGEFLRVFERWALALGQG